ncbi:hypothetical protein F4824DRAFT_500587 [Ustulina deusta]|nr:hypothetical protein F4824DRAFT_500587 [Ustulina deusta]
MFEFELSSRGAANVAAIWLRLSNAVQERENVQSSVIDMTTSENFLLRDELIEFYKVAMNQGLSSAHMSYANGLAGDRDLLDALATFFNGYFRPLIAVEAQHITTAPGVAGKKLSFA